MSAARPDPANQPPPAPACETAPGRVVLLIDDNDRFRQATDAVLQHAGYRVHAVPNGAEAVRCFPRIHPDLVITDVVMPEKDGIETIAELKRDSPSLRIIAMSGDGHIGPSLYLELASLLGAICVLAKPFDHSTLLEAVERALAQPSRASVQRVPPA